MILIVGLGNPGKKYIKSRHNLGFMVADELSKRLEAKFRYSIRTNADIAKKRYEDKNILLAKPQTFMNNSGSAVRQIKKSKKISLANILLVYDELDLDFGCVRIRAKGTDAGHRGIKSVLQELNTKDIARIRIGIGRSEVNIDPSDYVLTNFNAEEKKQLPDVINKAVDACICWIEKGADVAMTTFN